MHENAAGVFPIERHRLMLYYEAGAFECLGGLTTSGKGNLAGQWHSWEIGYVCWQVELGMNWVWAIYVAG